MELSRTDGRLDNGIEKCRDLRCSRGPGCGKQGAWCCHVPSDLSHMLKVKRLSRVSPLDGL